MTQLTLKRNDNMVRRSDSNAQHKILLDFGANKSGGGAQSAVNFLDILEEDVERHGSIYLLLPTIGPLATKVLTGGYAGKLYSPARYSQRVLFEMRLPAMLRDRHIDLVYTNMGAGVPCPSGVKSLVTVAYPIICYPESPYWEHLAFRKRTWKKSVNVLRRSRLRKATRILAETEVMRRRLATVLGRKENDFGLLPPAATDHLRPTQGQDLSGGTNFVFLSGTDAHKNLWRLYALARELSSQRKDFTFTLTVDRIAFLSCLKESSIDDLTLTRHFRFLGAVSPDRVADVYRDADFMVNLSDLESFSNNYLEAWKAEVPIIASDRDFAHDICQDSACYVEPHDIPGTAKKIIELVNDPDRRETLVLRDATLIGQHPTNQDRYVTIWKEIDSMLGR